MITRNCDSNWSWFLLVNTTILVILSTRPQRVSSASMNAPLAPNSRHHHHNQQQHTTTTNNSERNNFRSDVRPSSHPTRTGSAQMKPAARLGRTQTAPMNEVNEHEDRQSQGQGQMARLSSLGNPALETNALAYLQRYGYMQASNGPETSNNLISEESFSSAISEFQRFAGLTETGQVDNETLNMMRMPRCGNTDKPLLRTTISKSGQLISSEMAAAASRVGSEDNSKQLVKQRRKRYALQGSKWRRQELTYRISQYPTKFAGGQKQEVDAQIERAFGIWSQVAPIDFVVKKEGRVHIDIRFASGDHGDGDAFDGPGNTLAHAYFPQYGGDAHFDDQEYWTVDSYVGTNIFQVAAHELGHSLGLGHSNVREALMAPFYQKYKPNFKLHLDDVLAIQALYGEKAFLPEVPADKTEPFASGTTSTTTQRPSTTSSTTSTTTTTRPFVSSSSYGGSRITPIYKGNRRPAGEEPTTTDLPPTTTLSDRDDNNNNNNPDLSPNGINGFDSTETNLGEPNLNGGASAPADLCFESTIDAITRTEDGNSYVFRGDHYWLLTNEGLARGYPRRISTDWEGLPGHLDAALTWADGKTFFFKGNKYWRFRNRRRDLGYPKLISAGFAGIPDDIDAAFVWSGNGRTYFFKGAEYWRFDSKAEPPVSSEYPRSIKVWLGVPAHINAAFKWENNVTYFFKGNQYYRFNDREFKAETRPFGRPPFPRQTAEWWFGCVGSNLAQRALPAATSRTARVYSNPGQHYQQRAPTAALLSGTSGSFARQHDHGDWSLLAGLNADHTRSMGTHISDHQKPSPQQPRPSSSPAGERNWYEEDNFSELDLDRRLEPSGAVPPSDRHDAAHFDTSNHLEPGERRRRPANTNVPFGTDRTTRTHRTGGGSGGNGFELAGNGLSSSFDETGVQYQTNSLPGTTAISQIAHKTSNGQSSLTTFDNWLLLVCSATILCWLATVGQNRKTIELYGGQV